MLPQKNIPPQSNYEKAVHASVTMVKFDVMYKFISDLPNNSKALQEVVVNRKHNYTKYIHKKKNKK